MSVTSLLFPHKLFSNTVKRIVISHIRLYRRQPKRGDERHRAVTDRPLLDGDVSRGTLGRQYVLGERPLLISFMAQIEREYIFSNSVGVSLCAAEVCFLMDTSLFNDAVNSQRTDDRRMNL